MHVGSGFILPAKKMNTSLMEMLLVQCFPLKDTHLSFESFTKLNYLNDSLVILTKSCTIRISACSTEPHVMCCFHSQLTAHTSKFAQSAKKKVQ